MTDVVIAEADTGSVAKRKPAQPDVNGVDAEFVVLEVDLGKSPEAWPRARRAARVR